MVGRVGDRRPRADRGPSLPERPGPAAGRAALGHPAALPRGPRRPARGGPGAPTAWSASGSIRGGSTTACSTATGTLLGEPVPLPRRRGPAAASSAVHDGRPAGRAVRPDRAPVPAVQHDLPARRGRGTARPSRRPGRCCSSRTCSATGCPACASPSSRTPRRPGCSTSIAGRWDDGAHRPSLGLAGELFAAARRPRATSSGRCATTSGRDRRSPPRRS